jgi:hypothetical protein
MIRNPSQDVFDRMVEREAKQSEQIKRIGILVDNFDGKFWGEIKKRLEDRAAVYFSDREAHFMELTEVNLKILKAREDELKRVMQMPEDLTASYNGLLKQNAELKEEIREYRKRLQAVAV